MGEVNWFYSLIKYLIDNNYRVIHCKDNSHFFREYLNEKKKGNNVKLIMDYITIPMTIKHLLPDINNIYCMCYWGRDLDRVKKLGNVNNMNISLLNVLTPFNYLKENTYLGYDMKYLCGNIESIKYKKIGILWGKDIKYININLVKYLTSKGLQFYSVTNTPLNIDGVHNLGILSKKLWHQLLKDGRYVLSFGNPPSGPTILESLFYKKRLFGPQIQYPQSVHNKNILFTDKLDFKNIFNLIIQNNDFIDHDEICNSLINSNNFNIRVKNIFNI